MYVWYCGGERDEEKDRAPEKLVGVEVTGRWVFCQVEIKSNQGKQAFAHWAFERFKSWWGRMPYTICDGVSPARPFWQRASGGWLRLVVVGSTFFGQCHPDDSAR